MSRPLQKFGPPTKTDERRSVAADDHGEAKRFAAKSALRYPPVILTGHQALAAASGFARACKEGDYVPLACPIMPDHVHFVLERHDRPIGQIIGHLKARGLQNIKAAQLWFDDSRPLWSEGSWRVFLNSNLALENAIQYVNENPIKAGLKPQHWSFVRSTLE